MIRAVSRRAHRGCFAWRRFPAPCAPARLGAPSSKPAAPKRSRTVTGTPRSEQRDRVAFVIRSGRRDSRFTRSCARRRSNAQPTAAPERGRCGGAQQPGPLRMLDGRERGAIRRWKNESQNERRIRDAYEAGFGRLPVLGTMQVAKARLLRIEFGKRLRAHLRAWHPGRVIHGPYLPACSDRRWADVRSHRELGKHDSQQRDPGKGATAKESHRYRIVGIGIANAADMVIGSARVGART